METIAKPGISEIADRIVDAIMEHRLPPGIKLAEEKLASAFGVSRTKIRQALTRLAKDGLVKLSANRGAFVASPTVQEALDLFAIRRLLEPEIIRNITARAGKPEIKRLRDHIALEAGARERKDRRAIIKLSGEFHMLLAEVSGNSFVDKIMSELCPLTCLIIALYDSPQTPACPEDEHLLIVDALEVKDTEKAITLMLHHLNHVEQALNLGGHSKPEIDWDRMFG